MKKFILLPILLLTLIICSCGKETDDTKKPSFNDDTVYSGFSDISDDYNAEAAIADGCYVIKDNVLLSGKEEFEAFLASSKSGKDTFLRIVHFIDDEPYFTDIYYNNGKYRTFEKNHERGITAGEEYTLLRRLEGTVGAAEKLSYFYVLTDSTELTYEDVSWSFLTSSLDTVTDIPFEWLGFTVYLD